MYREQGGRGGRGGRGDRPEAAGGRGDKGGRGDGKPARSDGDWGRSAAATAAPVEEKKAKRAPKTDKEVKVRTADLSVDDV
jgi:hypothetical protein